MIPNIMENMRKFYPNNKDLLKIKIYGKDIKIVGFKNKEVQLRLTKLIEKIK
jgi:hypothetical protein